MFRYYTGIAIMCVVFAVMALFFSDHRTTMTTIFLAMAAAFEAIAFVTADSRW
ncbi:hypothetical protein [Alicyclobacillus sp. SO9]|uniref:hypothetical protein n=1 Tax=Alicyclobacillus sp. SO9 TaxID=2665646 RepID=UPI0018E8F37C|nr:hypothetical protein [Alicyclobacillus sp. SO9]QQE76894.1 hypothetical protein GI364_12850 [Alicyclobacillus sp. SO9]